MAAKALILIFEPVILGSDEICFKELNKRVNADNAYAYQRLSFVYDRQECGKAAR